MIKKFVSGVKKGKVKMTKIYKCDRCRCQDICKLEAAFHTTQDRLDEIIENANGNFSFEFVCGRFIPTQHSVLANRTNEAHNACADNMTMNEYIAKENKNGRVER